MSADLQTGYVAGAESPNVANELHLLGALYVAHGATSERSQFKMNIKDCASGGPVPVCLASTG
jgi:hypothetical protein